MMLFCVSFPGVISLWEQDIRPEEAVTCSIQYNSTCLGGFNRPRMVTQGQQQKLWRWDKRLLVKSLWSQIYSLQYYGASSVCGISWTGFKMKTVIWEPEHLINRLYKQTSSRDLEVSPTLWTRLKISTTINWIAMKFMFPRGWLLMNFIKLH